MSFSDEIARHLIGDRTEAHKPSVSPIPLHVGAPRVALASEDLDSEVGGPHRVF